MSIRVYFVYAYTRIGICVYAYEHTRIRVCSFAYVLVHLFLSGTVKQKFLKDSKYQEDYVKFMNEIVSRGNAEEAPVLAQQERVKWYIPHHGVYNPKKNKIRVVFDCSARFRGNS